MQFISINLLKRITTRNLTHPQITWHLSTALHYLQEIQLSIDQEKDVEKWLNYSGIQWDLPAFEYAMDKILTALQSNALNETFSLTELEVCYSFLSMWNYLPLFYSFDTTHYIFIDHLKLFFIQQ